MTTKNEKKFRFAIDRGGTFTDVFALTPTDKVISLKVLSVNPEYYNDAPTYAIRKILKEESTTPIVDNNDLIDPSNIEWIRMGTTVATNALLESKGERFCFIVTKGFRDLLYIGNQSRPKLFDLSIRMPNVLYDDVLEVDERVVPYLKDDDNNDDLNKNIQNLANNQKVEVLKELDMIKLEKDLIDLKEKKGFKSIAVLLMHSYM
jgi:5-oxoprolinase (ATP-hydrolysing)